MGLQQTLVAERFWSPCKNYWQRFFCSYRQCRIGGGAGRETAVERRIGRTGLDQQEADACMRAGVENTEDRHNTSSIGVAALTPRGFNEQLGGGAGRRAAERRLAPRGLKQQRVEASPRERGEKAGKCNFFFLSAYRNERKGGSTNNSAAGWAKQPPRNSSDAQDTRNNERKKHVKGEFFFYRQPRINKKGVHRTNRRRGGPNPRLRETIRTHGTEEKKNCRKYARTLGKHRVRKQFFFIGTLELTEMGFKRRGGHKRRRATIRTHGTEAKNIC